ncbi:MAG: hypothetical protein JSR59_16600 [Proteobacteria bacterium]|nr:hypothetical protein [Pseudomonadota bacterium]
MQPTRFVINSALPSTFQGADACHLARAAQELFAGAQPLLVRASVGNVLEDADEPAGPADLVEDRLGSRLKNPDDPYTAPPDPNNSSSS